MKFYAAAIRFPYLFLAFLLIQNQKYLHLTFTCFHFDFQIPERQGRCVDLQIFFCFTPVTFLIVVLFWLTPWICFLREEDCSFFFLGRCTQTSIISIYINVYNQYICMLLNCLYGKRTSQNLEPWRFSWQVKTSLKS